MEYIFLLLAQIYGCIPMVHVTRESIGDATVPGRPIKRKAKRKEGDWRAKAKVPSPAYISIGINFIYTPFPRNLPTYTCIGLLPGMVILTIQYRKKGGS